MNTATQEQEEEALRFLLGDGHALARSVLHWFGFCWAIATTLALLSGNAWGQSHHRRRHHERQPVAQAQAAVAQPVQPVQPSGCTGQDELTARQARSTGADAYGQQDWETCATSYTISLTVANGACARPEARLNLAICLDASGHPTQALEQLNIIRENGQLPPGTNREALENRIVTVRRHAEQAAQPQRVVPSAIICAGAQRACGGICVDLQSDPRNCGGCGSACPSGNTCTNGNCRVVLTTEPPNTGSARRTASLGLIVGGGVLLGAGIGFLTLGAINSTKAGEDAARLAMNGCEVAGTSPTCLRYAPGSSRPNELAAWQLPVGGIMTGIGAVSLGVGIILSLTGQPPPPVRPAAGLNSIGFEGTF